MRIIHFKEQYKFKLDGEILIVDPIERILLDLKETTFRLNPKPLGNYRVIQGNYFKPIYDSRKHGWFLHHFMIKKTCIRDLSINEIQKDLGLYDSELKLILAYNSDLHDFFLQGLREINHNSHIQLTDINFLCHFEVVEAKVKTLDDYGYMRGL